MTLRGGTPDYRRNTSGKAVSQTTNHFNIRQIVKNGLPTFRAFFTTSIFTLVSQQLTRGAIMSLLSNPCLISGVGRHIQVNGALDRLSSMLLMIRSSLYPCATSHSQLLTNQTKRLCPGAVYQVRKASPRKIQCAATSSNQFSIAKPYADY